MTSGTSDDPSSTTTSATTMTTEPKIGKGRTKRPGHLSSRAAKMARKIRARASQLSCSDELNLVHTLHMMHEGLFLSPIPSRLTSVARSRLHKLLVYAFLSAWYDDFSRDPLGCLERGQSGEEAQEEEDDENDEACLRPTLRLMIQRVALEIGHMKYAPLPEAAPLLG